MESTKIFWHGIKWVSLVIWSTSVDVTLDFPLPVFHALLGAEQIKSLNTLSRLFRMPISTKKYRHQQVTSRLSASSVTVCIGTTFDASKWSIHRNISSALSVLLVGMSFTHRLYCSAWLQLSSRDRIGSRGCDCPLNRRSDCVMFCVGRSAMLFVIWRYLADRSRLTALPSLSPLVCVGLTRPYRSCMRLWLLPLLRALWLLRLSLSLPLRSLMFLDRYRIMVPLWGPLMLRFSYSDIGSQWGPLSSSVPHRSRSELVKVPFVWSGQTL